MPAVVRKSRTVAEQRLELLMQAINFGEILRLHVVDGQPVFEPRPEVIRFVRLGAENGPRKEMGRTESALKRPVLELLEEMRRLGNGCISRIVIKHGLPTDITLVGGYFYGEDG